MWRVFSRPRRTGYEEKFDQQTCKKKGTLTDNASPSRRRKCVAAEKPFLSSDTKDGQHSLLLFLSAQRSVTQTGDPPPPSGVPSFYPQRNTTDGEETKHFSARAPSSCLTKTELRREQARWAVFAAGNLLTRRSSRHSSRGAWLPLGTQQGLLGRTKDRLARPSSCYKKLQQKNKKHLSFPTTIALSL